MTLWTFIAFGAGILMQEVAETAINQCCMTPLIDELGTAQPPYCSSLPEEYKIAKRQQNILHLGATLFPLPRRTCEGQKKQTEKEKRIKGLSRAAVQKSGRGCVAEEGKVPRNFPAQFKAAVNKLFFAGHHTWSPGSAWTRRALWRWRRGTSWGSTATRRRWWWWRRCHRRVQKWVLCIHVRHLFSAVGSTMNLCHLFDVISDLNPIVARRLHLKCLDFSFLRRTSAGIYHRQTLFCFALRYVCLHVRVSRRHPRDNESGQF